jgi:phage repressor protein C with HTH and peptisase S24 domain
LKSLNYKGNAKIEDNFQLHKNYEEKYLQMNSILRRIKLIVDREGDTITSLENKIGASKGVLSRALKNDSDIQSKWVQLIVENYPLYNAEWLLIGKGDILKSNSRQYMTEQVASNISYANDDESLNMNFHESRFKQKGYSPYYGELPVSAGQHDLATISQQVEPESWIKIPNITADAWFPVIGCSMEPRVHAGDIIGIAHVNSWDKLDPDKIYLVITRDDRMIKHLEVDSEDNEIIWAISDNLKKIRLHRDDILNVYHVVFTGRVL